MFPSQGVTSELYQQQQCNPGIRFLLSVTHDEGNVSRLRNTVPDTQNVQAVTSRAKRCYSFRTITHVGTKAK